MHFEWDKQKSVANEKKHKISFDEASTVFYDDNALLFDDPDHSYDEDRFLLLGLSGELRALLPDDRRGYPHHLRPSGDTP